VVLVDGNSLLYRAHFAFIRQPLTNSRGMETSAVFGFARMLFDVIDRFSPEYLAVAWDKSRKSFRTDLFPEYKGTRRETPEPLVAQFPYSRRILECLGIRAVDLDDFEADDILGTLARRFAGAGREVLLVSGDRDVLQLVGDGVRAALTRKGISELAVYGPDQVVSEFGVTPARLVDLKGLAGDTSDNIPGVPKVGEKTAAKLLAEYGSLEGVYENIARIRGALATNLAQNRDLAFLSRTLGTIRTDAPVDLSLEQCRPGPIDARGLADLFSALELRQLLSRPEIKDALAAPAADEGGTYRPVTTGEDLDALAGALAGAERIGIVTATVEPASPAGEIAGIALAVEPDAGYYVPLAHRYLGAPDPLDADRLRAALAPAIASRPVVCEDLKALAGQLARLSLSLPLPAPPPAAALAFDVMLASYVLDPGRRGHRIDELSGELLSRPLPPPATLVPKGEDFSRVPVEAAALHAGRMAARALTLADRLQARMDDLAVASLYREVELPLIRVLADMEREGIGLNTTYLAGLSTEMEGEMKALERRIHEIAGEEFNVNSPGQLSRILFEKLGCPKLRRTKTGYSTDADVLAELASEHGVPVARLVNEYRHLAKLKGTYVDSLPRLVRPSTGRLHTTYEQAVAATGRLSSVDPNLQNIPIRTPEGMKIRRAFVARPGHRFVSGDYSQIELRILAHLSGSPFLKEAFAAGHDIHRQTAARMFGVPEAQVDPALRNRAKSINFGILYGMSPFGLARDVGITQAEARQFMDAYFAQLPQVKAFLAEQVEFARAHGYVTTIAGRRRYLPRIRSSNTQERQFAERTAVNTPVQGSAADLIKIAMIRLHGRLAAEQPAVKLLLSIHDELVLECPEAAVDATTRLVRETMEEAVSLSVPTPVNVSCGATWADLK
jgi:DNA polymerase-1